MIPAVEARGLTKQFVEGPRRTKLLALDRLNLRIPVGEVFGLLGPNGSGKSTTLKILLGLVTPTAGTGTIFGESCAEPSARRRLGFLPESPDFPAFLTGRELVAFHGRLAGLDRAVLAARVEEVIGWAGLPGAADRRIGTYSKGMRQRIGLAQALVARPRLVLLDEPTAGVDPAGARDMIGMIRRLREEGVTVLLTSHHLEMVEQVCDRVALLQRGRLVAEGTVAELTAGAEDLMLAGPELAPEERAELAGWLGARGGSLVPARRHPRLEQVWLERIKRG